MKLLLDQNLSHKLLSSITDTFPGSTQARLIGLADASDTALWQYAREESFCIVTKDSDFYERALVHGFPPKVIWLQCGNTSTEFVAQLLITHSAAIRAFLADAETACLELY